jgi:hypothetical protein
MSQVYEVTPANTTIAHSAAARHEGELVGHWGRRAWLGSEFAKYEAVGRDDLIEWQGLFIRVSDATHSGRAFAAESPSYGCE